MAAMMPAAAASIRLTSTVAWTHHVLSGTQQLWQEKILCDTTIECLDEKQLLAHSVVLASSSDVLKTFFSTSRPGLYTLRMLTVPQDICQLLLDFLYTGYLQLPVSELMALYNVARRLRVQELETMCEQYIQRSLVEKTALLQQSIEHAQINEGTVGNAGE